MSLGLDLKRIIREGLISFWRNATLSISTTLITTLSLFMLASLLFMNGLLDFSLAQLEERVDINIYFFPETPQEEIILLQEKIQLIPEVRDVQYVSREQAFTEFKERHHNDELIKRSLDELGDNPLGASLNIRAKRSRQYEAIVAAIETEPMVKNSRFVEKTNYHDNKQTIDRLNQFTSVVRALVYAALLIFMLIAVFIIMTTIRLVIHSSQDEVAVKRLVGAEMRYIHGPFMVSGVLYGLLAGVLTLALIFPLTMWVSEATATFFGGMNVLTYFKMNFLQFAIIICASGILLALVSTHLALRKYIRV